ncbi:hypothetical protein GUITHDRAFT_116473 [Guillardia theta CCMP2712]|uniref:Uncharacterized protein n=1 Tax=Guillardia theta (strain CCMP2712) TaxID=905079 RepID=L1INI0_GUITC|nr:hypothetical protein GUITHDRAFT_116473 [Guillardia theta CCMP2712]EKX37360.1 hypothetical protein GUITHDRAFT_116473 [Guillardia theta CCMP2712]|eukprot:XP_005824340.1 hypothetical protein GUITHDRAFT_116473 [Guillardia theta CCMP2712]
MQNQIRYGCVAPSLTIQDPPGNGVDTSTSRVDYSSMRFDDSFVDEEFFATGSRSVGAWNDDLLLAATNFHTNAGMNSTSRHDRSHANDLGSAGGHDQSYGSAQGQHASHHADPPPVQNTGAGNTAAMTTDGESDFEYDDEVNDNDLEGELAGEEGWVIDGDWVFVRIGTNMLWTGEDDEVMKRLQDKVHEIEAKIQLRTLEDATEAAEEVVTICEAIDREEERERAESSNTDRQRSDSIDSVESIAEGEANLNAFLGEIDSQRSTGEDNALSDGTAAVTSTSHNHPASISSSSSSSPNVAEECITMSCAHTQDGPSSRNDHHEKYTVCGSRMKSKAWRRRDLLGKSKAITDGLCDLLYRGDAAAKITACAAITGLSQNHVENSTRLGTTPNLLEGLLNAMSAPGPSSQPSAPESLEEIREVACQALVHLAMQNQYNKLAIVRCDGMLGAIRDLLTGDVQPDTQDTAAMVIANCADNFAAGGGAEAAERIVETPGMLRNLCDLLVQSLSTWTDSADRSAGLAAVISLSDHPKVLPKLRQGGIVQCLEKMLNSNEIGKEYDAMRAEVTDAFMALSNLAEDPSELEANPAVLTTVVRLGQDVIWAVRECLKPLVRISSNISNRKHMVSHRETSRVFTRLLKRWLNQPLTRHQNLVGIDEEVALTIILIGRMLEVDNGSLSFGLKNRKGVTSALSSIVARKCEPQVSKTSLRSGAIHGAHLRGPTTATGDSLSSPRDILLSAWRFITGSDKTQP